jgi:SsrA-binding protein
MAKKQKSDQRRIANRRARHDYNILAKIEAGIVLVGSEVKSLRAGKAQITDGFVRINDDGATLYDAQIDRYPPATDQNHEPKRKRRLLLHRRELRKLANEQKQTGVTIIPLSLYFNSRGIAKIELGVATGKKQHDRRQDLKKRQHQKDIDRAMSRRR